MDKIIQVRVTANTKKNKVEKFGEGFKVWLVAPAIEGKANTSLVKVLADYFNLKKSQVSIASGEKSKDKTVKLEGVKGINTFRV